jgi:hypothetical protein
VTNVADLESRRVEAFLGPLAQIEPVSRPRRRSRRPRARVAAAVAVGAAAAAAALALPGERHGGAAAAVLERAAQAAARQPLAPAGGYTYARTISKSRITSHVEPPWTVTVFRNEEVWLAVDGSGRATTRYGRIDFHDARAREAWQHHGDALIPWDRRFTLRPKFRDVESLPRDADRLYRLVRAEAERVSSGKRGVAPYKSLEHLLWSRLTTLLGAMHPETNRRPQLRAAIFGAFAKVDGADALGRMLDPLGRPGIGVAFAVDGLRDVIVFDERTSRLLAFKTVVTDRRKAPFVYYEAEAGKAVSWTAFLPPARVGSLDERPARR